MAGRPEPGRIMLVVAEAHIGLRLDHYLQQNVPDQSRSQLQKWVRQGHVLVNGASQPVRYQMALGDEVAISVSSSTDAPEYAPIGMPLDIVFEDEHVIVINKPAGIAVHPGAGEQRATLVQGVLAHCQQLSDLPEAEGFRPGVVHRLDLDTTGLVVFAKTNEAHRQLAQQFHDKTNQRSYRALLDGRMTGERQQVVCSYLHRDPKHRTRFVSMSVSDFEVMYGAGASRPGYRFAESHLSLTRVYADRLSEVQIELKTGRTHQIRVHAATLGLPVWGDQLYGRPGQMLPQTIPAGVQSKLQACERQLLHAETLGFHHPQSNEWQQFHAPLPADFAELLTLLAPFCPSESN